MGFFSPLRLETDGWLLLFGAQQCEAQLCVIGLTAPINPNWKRNAKLFIMQDSRPVKQRNLLIAAVLRLILFRKPIFIPRKNNDTCFSVCAELADMLRATCNLIDIFKDVLSCTVSSLNRLLKLAKKYLWCQIYGISAIFHKDGLAAIGVFCSFATI